MRRRRPSRDVGQVQWQRIRVVAWLIFSVLSRVHAWLPATLLLHPIENLFHKSRRPYPVSTAGTVVEIRSRKSPLFLSSRATGSAEGDDLFDLDELWVEGDEDDGEDPEEWLLQGPDAFLDDDDLSRLYDIPIPGLTSTNNNNNNNTTSELQRAAVHALPKVSMGDINSNVAYFYLRDEIGLSEDVMWKITNEAGSILGMKTSTLREKVDVLKKTMSLSNVDVRMLISAQPTLLHLSAKKNLSPTILFLARQLDLAPSELRTLVIGCPALLSYSIPNLQDKILFFQESMQFSIDETRSILLRKPTLLTSNAHTGLLPRFQFLRKEVGIPINGLQDIVKKNPDILKMSVDNNLQPKLIFFFIMTLYMSPEEVQKVLTAFPQVVNYSLEEHLLPITRYILSLDIAAHELARMVLKFPRLFTNSLPKIKRTVGYLRFALGLEASDVRRILYQCPQVVSLSTANLEAKVDFLCLTVGPNPDQETVTPPSTTTALRRVIVGMPNLLKLSIEKNLQPKVAYLRTMLGDEEFALALQRLPTLLGYSLENRIQPRLQRIVDAGVDGASITVGISMKDDSFESWLAGRKKKQRKSSLVIKPPAPTSEGAVTEAVLSTEDRTLQESGAIVKKQRVVQNDGRITHWKRREKIE